MKRMVSILIIIAVLLSGCISNKPVDSKDSSNKDEYSSDDIVEEEDSGAVQVAYDDLDINNKNPKTSDGYNATLENIANNTR